MVLERSELCGCSVRFLGEGERGLELGFHAFYSDCNSVTPERPDGRLLSHNETGLRYPLLENCIIDFLYTSSLIVGGAYGVYTILGEFFL